MSDKRILLFFFRIKIPNLIIVNDVFALRWKYRGIKRSPTYLKTYFFFFFCYGYFKLKQDK